MNLFGHHASCASHATFGDPRNRAECDHTGGPPNGNVQPPPFGGGSTTIMVISSDEALLSISFVREMGFYGLMLKNGLIYLLMAN